MNTNNERKNNLLEKLKNKEYRDSYVSSSVDVGVAFQVRSLRKQNNYTQNKLSDISGMAQERISALENPSNSHSIATLKKIANALDVGLIVRFVPLSDVVKWELTLSHDSLKAISYPEDPYFKNKIEEDFNIIHEEEQQKQPSVSHETLFFLNSIGKQKQTEIIKKVSLSKQKYISDQNILQTPALESSTGGYDNEASSY